VIRTSGLVVGHRAPLLPVPDLALQRGRLVAVVGPNGVGKTTLLETLAGRLPAVAGSVSIDGISIHSLSARDRARRLAYLPADDPSGEPMLVGEAVSQGRLCFRRWALSPLDGEDQAAVTRALSSMALLDDVERSTVTLSSGEQQRVWIAMALAQSAPALLLDEPTSHLDIGNVVALMRSLSTVAKEGRCVVVVLHDLNLAAAFADAIVLLGPGRVVATGPPRRTLTPALLSAAYGTRMRVLRDPDGGLLIAPALCAREPTQVSRERPPARI